MANKPTLTIAITAYNEENSLPQLLLSIRKVKLPELRKIILISDGSTDNTSKIIKKIRFGKIPVIRITDKIRLGKIYRLNQIFSISNTTYLMILDADIKIQSNTIQNLLKSATLNNAVLTVSHQIPIMPKNLVGKIIYTGYQLWDQMRTSDQSNLDYVDNFYGASSLYHYRFYHKLNIPQAFHDERKFIYYSAKQNGRFVYDKNSLIYYHPVSTFRDFYLFGGRSAGVDTYIEKYFPNRIINNFNITTDTKIKVLKKYLILHPLLTLMFITLKYTVKLLRVTDPLTSKGMWTISSSTKSGFANT